MASDSLEKDVEFIESKGILPCVTAWCNHCKKIKSLSHPNHVHYGAALEDILKRYNIVRSILSTQ
eukprot:734541-Hanusia_phi.AAC.1